MTHPDPILRAIPCPPSMVPRGASALVRKAEAAGWDVRVGIALGYRTVGRADSGVYRHIRSVMVEARRSGFRLTALWEGPIDGSVMKFDEGRWTPPRDWGYAMGLRDLTSKLTEVDAL